MIVNHLSNLNQKEIISDQVKTTSIGVMIGENEGWKDHVMRVLTVEKGGYTPKHSHPWPHINYIISGEGTLLIKTKQHPIKAGSYAFVDDNTLHQFKNTGDVPLVFICIVPKRGHH